MPVSCKGGSNSPFILPELANLYVAVCGTMTWAGAAPDNLDQQLFDDNFLNLEIDGTFDLNNDVTETKTPIVGACGAKRVDVTDNGATLGLNLRPRKLTAAIRAGQLTAEELWHMVSPLYEYNFDWLLTPYAIECGTFDFTNDIAWVGTAKKTRPSWSMDPTTSLTIPITANVERGIYELNGPTA